ncbi:MAG: hypothetical protein HOC78_02940 [Candidatus Komeilibacteria bacterium]|jgi:hypothetical protein|nr:hypothetical protein [Candidatus Komeilibacteria bacterium]
MDIYKFVGILGLSIISVGVFWQKKYVEDLLYVLGGIALFIYSYHIKEWIFVVLQVIFVISALSHLFRLLKNKKD